MASQVHSKSYLRLKSGVSLTQSGGEFRLGLPTRGLLLKSGQHLQIARSLGQVMNAAQIAAGLNCQISEVLDFVELLRSEGFIDLQQQISDEVQLDLSAELIALRESSERALLSHRSGVVDAGLGELRGRQRVSILISGENRLARNLLAALLASGFTHTRLISRRPLPHRISAEDVCGLTVRTSDIGKVRKEFSEEIARSSRISKSELLPKNQPDLIISTLPTEWDYVQRWMSEGSRHLHINPLIGPEIEVGPLVIPGATPCLRCVTLIKRDNGTSVEQEFIRSELPSAAVAYLAGLVALAVGELFATGSSPLQAASLWYDLLQPTRAPEKRHWSFHPECGCQS